MKILVCLKQILDPDIPARDFAVDPSTKEAVRGSADLVTNIFCENALETALQLRDAADEASITVLTVGTEETEEVLRKALALEVDAAALVSGDAASEPDAAGLAEILAAAATHLGTFDLVMLGRESGDWGGGQTGGLLAEELGLPFVAFVDHIEPTGGGSGGGKGLRLRRQTDAGTEILEATGPVVVSITNCDGNLPRIPKTRNVMKSYKKPLLTLSLAELGVDADAMGSARLGLERLFVPEKGGSCEMAEGDSLEARVDAFARLVAETLGGAA